MKKKSIQNLLIIIFSFLFFCVFWVFVVSPIMSKFMRDHYRRLSYITKIKQLGDITKRHLVSCDVIPESFGWCDILEKEYHVSKDTFLLPEHYNEKDISCYALNKNIVGQKVATIHPKTVLLFESKPGWNQIGDWNDLDTSYHENKGCCIYFFDGTAEYIKKKDLKKLKWK